MNQYLTYKQLNCCLKIELNYNGSAENRIEHSQKRSFYFLITCGMQLGLMKFDTYLVCLLLKILLIDYR